MYREYWKKIVQPYSGGGPPPVGDIYRWYFEALKNLVVLGAVRYFATKTGDTFLSVLSQISNFVFFAYMLYPIFVYSLRPFYFLNNGRVRFLLNAAFGITITLVLIFTASKLLDVLVDDLALAQQQ